MPQLQHIAAKDDGPFGDHLRHYLWTLHDQPSLRKALLQIIAGGSCEDEDSFQRLSAGGLIAGDSRQMARVRCDLYARYMREHL